MYMHIVRSQLSEVRCSESITLTAHWTAPALPSTILLVNIALLEHNVGTVCCPARPSFFLIRPAAPPPGTLRNLVWTGSPFLARNHPTKRIAPARISLLAAGLPARELTIMYVSEGPNDQPASRPSCGRG